MKHTNLKELLYFWALFFYKDGILLQSWYIGVCIHNYHPKECDFKQVKSQWKPSGSTVVIRAFIISVKCSCSAHYRLVWWIVFLLASYTKFFCVTTLRVIGKRRKAIQCWKLITVLKTCLLLYKAQVEKMISPEKNHKLQQYGVKWRKIRNCTQLTENERSVERFESSPWFWYFSFRHLDF